MFKTIFASCLLATVAATVANAAPVPTMAYQIYDGSTLIGSDSSTDGSLFNGSGKDKAFKVSLDATAAPQLTSPNFSSTDYTVTKLSSATGTITIKITDYNLPAYAGSNILNTFTLNSLNAPGFSTGTISNYVDSSNTAFGTAVQLASVTYTGSQSFSTVDPSAIAPMASLFSETAIYTLTFTGADSNSTVSASSQLNSVPEPASIALMGTTLAAVGMIRRRKQAA